MLRLKASLKSGDMDSTEQIMRISIYENDNKNQSKLIIDGSSQEED